MENSNELLRFVGAVAINSRRPASRSSEVAAHHGDHFHQRERLGGVVLVGTSQRGRERNAVRVCRNVVLGPFPPTIR